MRSLFGLAVLSAVLVGCHAGRAREGKFGPPPPGYIKIRGEAVPGWEPAHMHAAPRGAGRAMSWYPLGPRPILYEYWSGDDDASGRVVSVAPHPIDANMVYAASASGGIWKTTDGGTLWIPLTDELSNLNHGCVALDPANPDTVYAGTGEYTTQSSGDGLFRSLDGGNTWARIATSAQVGSTCSRIIVDPTDPLRIHVTGNTGYVRSTDGGNTWSTQLAGSASDLAVNPANPQIVYVGRQSDGVYRSTNGGTSFVKLGGGLPGSGIGRIILAIAASSPSTVYAALLTGSSLQGLYRTNDDGNNWVLKPNTPNFPSPQGWYDACLQVNPSDPENVYAGGVFPSYAVAGIIKTTNGGNNWTDVTIGVSGGQLHPDQHAIAFGPTGTVWIGNDGGVWKSNNGGQSWINTNDTLTVTQNYNIALHPTDPAQVMGGTQDNGTVGRDFDVEEWPQVLGGDGGFLAFDHTNPNIKYTTYVRLSIYRFVNGFYSANITGPWGGDPVNFIAPLVMDPNDSHTLLGGTNRVWRTNDAHAGASWSTISTSTVAGGGTLNALAVGTGASDTIYSGSSTGRVYVTTNASTWNNRTAGLPSGQVADIVLDPTNPGTAYVSFHNTSGPRVLRTDNYGVNWADRTGTLPAGVSARALAVDWKFATPNLYVGTGVGVYSSNDDGVTWVKDGLDLPNVNIGDLAIDTLHNTITVGTYGRGAWRSALPGLGLAGDMDGDGDVDLNDFASFALCFGGSNVTTPPGDCDPSEFDSADLDGDNDVDLNDFSSFSINFTG